MEPPYKLQSRPNQASHLQPRGGDGRVCSLRWKHLIPSSFGLGRTWHPIYRESCYREVFHVDGAPAAAAVSEHMSFSCLEAYQRCISKPLFPVQHNYYEQIKSSPLQPRHTPTGHPLPIMSIITRQHDQAQASGLSSSPLNPTQHHHITRNPTYQPQPRP